MRSWRISRRMRSVGKPPSQHSVAPMRRKPSAYGSPPATIGRPTRCATTSSLRTPAVYQVLAMASVKTSRSCARQRVVERPAGGARRAQRLHDVGERRGLVAAERLRRARCRPARHGSDPSSVKGRSRNPARPRSGAGAGSAGVQLGVHRRAPAQAGQRGADAPGLPAFDLAPGERLEFFVPVAPGHAAPSRREPGAPGPRDDEGYRPRRGYFFIALMSASSFSCVALASASAFSSVALASFMQAFCASPFIDLHEALAAS